ncbi:MAG: enoyl-CoA hydratase/isomerase family protein [Alphaproteobacteria bacterium]
MSDRYAAYKRLKIDWPAERILRITFDRPERLNAVDTLGHTELVKIWRDIDEDHGVSAVILTGAGKAFSAGGDFEMIEGNYTSWDHLTNTWKEARDLVYNCINCSKPIVSAMRGPAVGAGLTCGLLADVSIGGKSLRIIDGHTRLGVAAGDHACIIWPLLCGMAKAKYYLLTCDQVGGEEAERIGLISMCVEDDQLQDKALDVAKKLAAGAPSAVRWTKYSLNNWFRMAGPTFDTSTALEMLGMMGPEVREGLASLKEKRTPKFNPSCKV